MQLAREDAGASLLAIHVLCDHLRARCAEEAKHAKLLALVTDARKRLREHRAGRITGTSFRDTVLRSCERTTQLHLADSHWLCSPEYDARVIDAVMSAYAAFFTAAQAEIETPRAHQALHHLFDAAEFVPLMVVQDGHRGALRWFAEYAREHRPMKKALHAYERRAGELGV